MHAVLIIVSCHLAYFRYDDGSRSPTYVGHFCADENAELVRRRAQAWKDVFRVGLVHDRSRPLTVIRPRRTWARDYGGRTGWKR